MLDRYLRSGQNTLSRYRNMSTRKSKLDQLLQPSRQYKYHQVLRDASFFAAIDPQDPLLQSRSFALWKYFQIMFMFTLCLRLLVECFLSKDSPILLYMGDFKIWWGKLAAILVGSNDGSQRSSVNTRILVTIWPLQASRT